MSVELWSFSKAAIVFFFPMNYFESLGPLKLLSPLPRGMVVPSLKATSLRENTTLFTLFLIILERPRATVMWLQV